ncbi:hypothetical protein V6Z12_D13G116300 [Gossypium hirsutum]
MVLGPNWKRFEEGNRWRGNHQVFFPLASSVHLSHCLPLLFLFILLHSSSNLSKRQHSNFVFSLKSCWKSPPKLISSF